MAVVTFPIFRKYICGFLNMRPIWALNCGLAKFSVYRFGGASQYLEVFFSAWNCELASMREMPSAVKRCLCESFFHGGVTWDALIRACMLQLAL